MDSIIENKGLMKAVSFGLNEQLITLMAVMSGFLGYSRKRIILALIIMSFSNSIPDAISYYQDNYEETKDRNYSIKQALFAFMSEMMASVIILVPIILIKNTHNSIKLSYLFIASILFINLRYLMKYDLSSTSIQMVIYGLVGICIYYISYFSSKYFNLNV